MLSVDIALLLYVLLVLSAFAVYRYLKEKNLLSKSLFWMLVCNVLALTFFMIVLKALRTDFILALDTAVSKIVPLIWSEALTIIMVFFTSFIQPAVILSFTACMTLLLIWHKDRKHALLFAISVVSAAALDFLLKAAVQRLRPLAGLLVVDSYSFPSGHAFLAVVFFGAIALTYTKWIPWKKTFVWLCCIAALLVAASRIYLDVHWMSDVIGGVFLGIFWLTLCFLSYHGVELAIRRKLS